MSIYSLCHVSDRDLLRDLASSVAEDRTTTTMLLARIAEVDARRLYAPAGFPSMYLYCVHELHLSEEAARKRIHAARTARQFSAIFDAIAEGRLHLSAVIVLAPHLTPENADELLAAAAHKTRAEIEQLLAERFPRPDLLAAVQAISPSATVSAAPSSSFGPIEERAPGRVEAERPRVTTLAPQRFPLRLALEQATHDKLRYLQELLSHQVPSGDLARVLDRTFDVAIRELERRKFSATSRPRPNPQRATSRRHIPAHVKRAVWERDGGRCTFVSPTGRRCPARAFLEFDHMDPVALGGQSTVERVRLRCRAHNQYAAECTFGAEFMRKKREEARRARAEARERAAAAAEKANELDVVPWLRQLGFRADQARRAATHCDDTVPDATLEERLRAALRFLSPSARGWSPAATPT